MDEHAAGNASADKLSLVLRGLLIIKTERQSHTPIPHECHMKTALQCNAKTQRNATLNNNAYSYNAYSSLLTRLNYI